MTDKSTGFHARFRFAFYVLVKLEWPVPTIELYFLIKAAICRVFAVVFIPALNMYFKCDSSSNLAAFVQSPSCLIRCFKEILIKLIRIVKTDIDKVQSGKTISCTFQPYFQTQLY